MGESVFTRIDTKLSKLLEYSNDLKEENRLLKRKIYSLQLELNQAKARTAVENSPIEKRSDIAKERDSLLAEKDVLRSKVESLLALVEESLAVGGNDE